MYTDGTVTEDESRQGFTVKQGKTTIHKDSQATHAILLSDFMSLLQKVKNGMGSPDWHVSVFDIHLQKLLWIHCPGHAGVKRNDRADRLAGKATLTSGLLLGRSEMLRLSLIHISEPTRRA